MYCSAFFGLFHFAGEKPMSLDYEEELDYKATTATLPKRDWYHAKFMCRVFAAEALGLGLICFLVTVHGGTGSLKSDVSGPVTASAAFAVAVWIVGPVSGPQITPILSIALLLTRRINFVYCILGIAGQICGGVLGVALGSRLIPGMSERNDVFFQNPGPGVTDGQAFGMECVCSFLLIICCLSTMDEFRKPHWADGHITVFSLVVFLLILMLASPLVSWICPLDIPVVQLFFFKPNPILAAVSIFYPGKLQHLCIFLIAKWDF